MVMTILEGRVANDQWSVIEQSFQEASQFIDPGLVQSLLVQNSRDPGLWRIITLWSSREALDAMRSSGTTPRGVLIFRSARSVPELSIFDVRGTIESK